jgi:undecaprenyl-diphosphatase
MIWLFSLVIYLIPDADHRLLSLFNDARANDKMFAYFWYNYTLYMPYVNGGLMLAIYFASFVAAPLKPYRMALFAAILMFVIGSPLVEQLKVWVNRPRPFVTYPDITNLYEAGHAFGQSFPSGHAYIAFAETLALTSALISKEGDFKPIRYFSVIILITIAVSLSLSRIFVGVHYLSDILFSIGLAIFLEVAVILGLKSVLKKRWLNAKNEKIIAFIFVTLTVLVSVFS